VSERLSGDKITTGRESSEKPAVSKNPGFLAGITYTAIALSVAGLFLAVTLLGSYTWVARVGGAAWVFVLAMVILMPPVISYYKRKRA